MFITVYDMCGVLFFFFKQKTAYEMRISDWSSDVCSSDLLEVGVLFGIGRGGTAWPDERCVEGRRLEAGCDIGIDHHLIGRLPIGAHFPGDEIRRGIIGLRPEAGGRDRKSTRLNSSH